jgi:hypothetical protein
MDRELRFISTGFHHYDSPKEYLEHTTEALHKVFGLLHGE